GFEVALVGPPNSGKSTLLNRLAGRDAAITSDIAGTTRDVIEVKMDLEGLPVTVLDTAGLRSSTDVLEEIGIERGKLRAQAADVRVHLVDDPTVHEGDEGVGLDIWVQSKRDSRVDPAANGISGLTGDGVDQLLAQISRYLSEQVAGAGTATRTRHEQTLSKANVALKDVLDGLLTNDTPVDLLAEDLRLAIRALDSLIGRVDVENVLGEIFSSFCIGK
ncbi:50S ribosome-binding GTPase, partial [Octadecabacter sp.]|nr:50S ribosome-binding GTPase [Octadecabacter sp.]